MTELNRYEATTQRGKPGHCFCAQVFVGSDGLLKFVYDDELQPLLALGSAIVARASHVEPTPQGWTADMGPSGGPVLGPFDLRGAALAAELQWLDRKFNEVTL